MKYQSATDHLPPWQIDPVHANESHEKLDLNQTSIYKIHLNRMWYQGRGVYGGLIAGAFMQAMQYVDSLWTPRTLTIHFCAPAVEGEYFIYVSVVRRGKKVKHVQAHMSGDQGIVAISSATFAQTRSCLYQYPAQSMPQVVQPNEALEVPQKNPLMPSFCQFLRYQFCLHNLPYSGSEIPALGGWCDFRQNYVKDHAYLCALLDAWPPAVFSSLTQADVGSTVDLTYHFLHSDLHQLEGPFLYSGEVLSMSEGYAEERDFLWDRNGIAVASARQLIALGK